MKSEHVRSKFSITSFTLPVTAAQPLFARFILHPSHFILSPLWLHTPSSRLPAACYALQNAQSKV